VDEIWRDPPVSTEQVLHPERYAAGERPVSVPRPALTDTLGSGWRLLETNTNGEWYTYLILAYGAHPDARLGEQAARRAADGWGGDSYSVFYHDGNETAALAAQWVWDSEADADEFAAAFREYAGERWGEPEHDTPTRACWSGSSAYVCLHSTPTGTLWLMGPGRAEVEAMRGEYPEFQ
jgi:hypothetical protein